MRFETLCLVCLLFLGSFLPRLVAATPAKSDPPVADRGQANRAEAARLLRRALGAEAAGRAADRTEFLNQARAAAPDYPPVRWHMGEVRLGNRWVPIREAASITNTDERVARYEALRATLRDTVNDHLKIARWCEHEGLVDQQRAHLLGALALQIDLEEAIVKLQAIQRRQAAAAEQQARALRIGPKQLARRSPWRSMVRKVEAGLDGDRPAQREPALRQLRAIRDPAAIPALEQLCDYDSAGAGGAVIAALSAMPEQAAADALVRLVLSSPDLQFSKLAASGLSSHSLFAYVPTFMSVLRPPALVKYEQFVVNDSIGHRLSIVDETPTAKHVTDSVGQPTGTFFIGPKRQFGAIYPDPTIERDRLQAAQALRVNQMRQFANERAILALQAATGKDVGQDPSKWWEWWTGYNELYQPPKPEIQNISYVAPLSIQRISSCFPAGTIVWTATGACGIERVQVGDCVLAQESETGELAYKPIVGLTNRPPSPLVEVKAGSATIRATRGHPFWVSGLGWQMAKELQTGQRLHTITGPLEIDAVSTVPGEPCYNLIVADFNTYFVSDEKVLVHDNNIRQVTSATVPGLVEQ